MVVSWMTRLVLVATAAAAASVEPAALSDSTASIEERLSSLEGRFDLLIDELRLQNKLSEVRVGLLREQIALAQQCETPNPSPSTTSFPMDPEGDEDELLSLYLNKASYIHTLLNRPVPVPKRHCTTVLLTGSYPSLRVNLASFEGLILGNARTYAAHAVFDDVEDSYFVELEEYALNPDPLTVVDLVGALTPDNAAKCEDYMVIHTVRDLVDVAIGVGAEDDVAFLRAVVASARHVKDWDVRVVYEAADGVVIKGKVEVGEDVTRFEGAAQLDAALGAAVAQMLGGEHHSDEEVIASIESAAADFWKLKKVIVEEDCWRERRDRIMANFKAHMLA